MVLFKKYVLTERERKVLELAHRKYTYAEIAVQTGATLTSVCRLMRSAHVKLRQAERIGL